MNITEFYQKNCVEKNFDEDFYIEQSEGLKDFYQPHCKESLIPDRQRLFYHYVFFGKSLGLFANREESKKANEEKIKKNNELRGRDGDIDLRDLDKYIVEEEIKNMDGYVADHNRHYFINRYAHKLLSTMSPEEKDNYILNGLTKKFEEMNNVQVQELISEKYPDIILEEIQ